MAKYQRPTQAAITRRKNARVKELSEEVLTIPDGKRMTAISMIQRIAFFEIEIGECEKRVAKDGAIYNFKNGSQQMLIEHPASKVIVQYTKQLLSYQKQFLALVPDKKKTVKKFNKKPLTTAK